MTAKIRHCDECERFDEIKYRTVCSLGHKPRFYKQHGCGSNTSWGWKRKCEDFKETNRGPDRLD